VIFKPVYINNKSRYLILQINVIDFFMLEYLNYTNPHGQHVCIINEIAHHRGQLSSNDV